MSPRPTKPPERPSISVFSLLTPLLTLVLGVFLAKHHSGHLDHLTTPILSLIPQCPPTKICPFFYRRSKLPSGRFSTRLFDVPRRHLHSNYSALSSIAPNTQLVHQWHHPRVIVFDGGFDPLVRLLLKQAHGTFLPTTVVDDHNIEVLDRNRVSDTAFISPHRDDLSLNKLTDQLARLIGLPNRQYSEVIEVNRYNETGFWAIHYDFLSEAALLDNSTFHGCQRVATAVLQLTDVQGGETVFVRDQSFKGGFRDLQRDSDDVLIVPTKKGRLVAWFNLHPETEDIDKATWHGSMPVTEGQKIAATFYLRNCSQADNSRRRAQMEAFMKNGPAPSTGVAEASKKSLYDDLDDDGLDDDVDNDDDGEDDALDPEEDAEYFKDLRKYREIRDSAGNSTEALIEAGYSPEDFEDLDKEVLMMDDIDGDEEDKKEVERLRLYKKIKEEGGKVVENLRNAGFKERDFEMLDETIELFGDDLDTDLLDENEPEDDDKGKGEGDGSMHDSTEPRVGGTGGGEGFAAEGDEGIDEEDHLEAERELGMDAESIRAFEQQLREQGIGEEETSDAQGEEVVREDGELGMDEESIRAFEQQLLEEQMGDGEGEEGGQCGGDDDFGDFVDDDDFDDFDFEEGEFGQEDDWGGEDGWEMMGEDGTGGGERVKVIPPGSVA